MNKDPGMASAVAAIRTLLEFLKRDKGVFLSFNRMYSWKQELILFAPSGETIQGLRESLKWATACLTGVDSSVAVSSGGELFLRFISLTSLEHQVRGFGDFAVRRLERLEPGIRRLDFVRTCLAVRR